MSLRDENTTNKASNLFDKVDKMYSTEELRIREFKLLNRFLSIQNSL